MASGPRYARPGRLREGATVAVLSPSWGGPHVFPGVFEAGLSTLRDRLGLLVKEYPTTRWSPDALAADPKRRAAELTEAFADDRVDAIVAAIGGDDSARILEHLDAEVIASNPKVLLGYSDTTAPLLFCHQLGMVTFHGPSVMAGLAQLSNFPEAERVLRAVLFDPTETLEYPAFSTWVDGYPDWASGATTQVGARRDHDGWRWLHAPGHTEGLLVGGCVEVLEFLKGSRYWPEARFWDDRILFLETSEETPTVQQVRRWLFGYGVEGVFERITALLVGRARGYTDDQKRALDEAVHETVVGQFGAGSVTIVTNMDFGHTDPQWVLPLGVRAALDPTRGTFSLVEPATS